MKRKMISFEEGDKIALRSLKKFKKEWKKYIRTESSIFTSYDKEK